MIAVVLAAALQLSAPSGFTSPEASVADARTPWWTDASAPGAALASPLAPRMVEGAAGVPSDWLAQRSIDRQWGLSDDSLYTSVDVKGWKSEGLAMALSAALPGAGERYVGERSAWLFLAAEAASWIGRTISGRRADDLHAQAVAFVGDPTDTSATWSFERYRDAGGTRVAELEQLWRADRSSFYRTLADDPTVAAGFSGSSADAFQSLHDDYQSRRGQAHAFELALWVNHAVSAFHALRAAHVHNLSLHHDVDVQLGARLQRGRPVLRAALTRRF